MSAIQLQEAISQKSKYLPENLLQEVYDFMDFLAIKNNVIQRELSIMQTNETTHLEEEFLNYKELYPHE